MVQCQMCKADIISAANFTLCICKHVYCIECLMGYIEKNLACKIKCPLLACKEYIDDPIIRECLSNEKIKEYDQLSVLAALPTAMKCLTKDCPTLIIVTDNNTVFHCSYCDQPNCPKCKHRHYINTPCMPNANEDTFEKAALLAISRQKRKELVSQFAKDGFVPNPERFDCAFCCNLILPRQGMITRKCNHSICTNCFTEAMNNVNFIEKLVCPVCGESGSLDGREIICAIGMPKLMELNMEMALPKLFKCKHPGCPEMWDPNNCKGSFTCPNCKHANCMECNDIHETMSCMKFRQTQPYKDGQVVLNKLAKEKSVTCICGKTLIPKGGCPAILCYSCGREICFFTGKLAGNRAPHSCGCRPHATCHPDCIYGCFPEFESK